MSPTSEVDARSSGYFHTSDVSAASHTLEQFYVPHRLRPTSLLRFELDSTLVEAANVRVGHLIFGTDVTVDSQADNRNFVLAHTTSGSVEISSGSRTGTAAPSQATLLCVGDVARFDMPKGAALVTMSLDRVDLEAELAAMLGHQILKPIVFDFTVDIGSGPGLSLRHIMDLFRQQITDADTLGTRHRTFAATLAKATMSALLLSASHNYSDELSQWNDAVAMPATIAAAMHAIDADPTVIRHANDLARIASLSLRALEAGFERYVGIPPMAYVRRVKLERARNQLLVGDSTALTVTEVAYQWGFFHLGRFSAIYRDAFGENPSTTLLRRSPAGSTRRGAERPFEQESMR